MTRGGNWEQTESKIRTIPFFFSFFLTNVIKDFLSMDTKGVFNVNFKKIKRFKGLIYLQEKKKKAVKRFP